MLDPANDVVPPPTSPTNSSLSSSDLDTESTGSFFHDRSTTLGNLMGVTLQAITFRASSSSQRLQQENPVSAASGGRRNKKPKKSRGAAARRWWSLCRDECDSRRASLGQYLEVERRFGDGGGPAAELEEGLVQELPRNGRALFADGRVLPPMEVVEDSSPAAGLCRFSAVERWCSLV